jgi:hypothetical protein
VCGQPSPPGFFPERHRPLRQRICCRCIWFARRRIDSTHTHWTSGSSLCCGCLDVTRTQVLFVARVQAPPVARPPFVAQPRAHLRGASICAKVVSFSLFFSLSVVNTISSFRASCSLGLSATSQQYFSLRTNQPPTTSQQYFSFRTNQHQPPAKRTGWWSLPRFVPR